MSSPSENLSPPAPVQNGHTPASGPQTPRNSKASSTPDTQSFVDIQQYASQWAEHTRGRLDRGLQREVGCEVAEEDVLELMRELQEVFIATLQSNRWAQVV